MPDARQRKWFENSIGKVLRKLSDRILVMIIRYNQCYYIQVQRVFHTTSVSNELAEANRSLGNLVHVRHQTEG